MQTIQNRYNPFETELAQIKVDDLGKLREVREGWYVEYKQQVPNASSVAKSISAFANAYGGWLFYGIGEKSKEDPVAGSFPGITREEADGYLQRIRQSAAQQLSPPPHFELKALWGPSEEIELPQDCAIICIWVPWSPKAPHVHKSGVIYRRVADSSEPAAENDRHFLGELFKRSDEIVSKFKAWVDEEPEFAEEEKHHPYLRLLLTTDPWSETDIWLGSSTKDIRKMFNPEGTRTTLPFDAIHTTANGFVARQLSNNDPSYLTLTWYLDRRLNSEILIPVSYLIAEDLKQTKSWLDGYAHRDHFISVMDRYKFKKIKILDINLLFRVFVGIAEIQSKLHTMIDRKPIYRVKTKMLNTGRCVPFLDVKSVMEKYETGGMPVLFKTHMSMERGHHPDSFHEVDCLPETPDYAVPSVHATIIFIKLTRALGIPILDDLEDEPSFGEAYDEIMSAGARSIEVQALRNLRQSKF
jgi:hypothetical protein